MADCSHPGDTWQLAEKECETIATYKGKEHWDGLVMSAQEKRRAGPYRPSVFVTLEGRRERPQ